MFYLYLRGYYTISTCIFFVSCAFLTMTQRQNYMRNFPTYLRFLSIVHFPLLLILCYKLKPFLIPYFFLIRPEVSDDLVDFQATYEGDV